MNRSERKFFVILTLVILLVDVFFLLLSIQQSDRELHSAHFKQGELASKSFTLAKKSMELSVSQVAHFVAHDPSISRIFKQAHAHWLAEDKGKGGPKTAEQRRELLEDLRPRWERMQEIFKLRQLHFHFGAAEASFLRVHKPERFGDSLSELRHTIREAVNKNTSTSGFEVGRVYAGIRGVLPFPAGSDTPIGAIEVGSSFQEVLEVTKRETGHDYAVMLNEDFVRNITWPEYLREATRTNPMQNGLYREAATANANPSVTYALATSAAATPLQLLTQHEARYFFSYAVPITDFLGNFTKNYRPIGYVINWVDVTESVESHENDILLLIAYALLGFLFVELLIYLGLKRTTAYLRKRIDSQTAEIRMKNEELSAKNERLDHFSQAVAHDLKNPLQGVFVSTHSFRNHVSKGQVPPMDLVEKMERFANSMNRIINSLLQYATWDMQTVPKQDLHLATLVETTREELARTIEGRHATIEMKHLNLTICGHMGLLTQVFVNIVENAIKYTPSDRHPKIEIDAEDEGQHIVLKVKDNAKGIASKDLDSLFDHRYRVPGTQESGHGIGLHIAAKIIAGHKGSIRVESELGKGSTFFVTLPKCEQ